MPTSPDDSNLAPYPGSPSFSQPLSASAPPLFCEPPVASLSGHQTCLLQLDSSTFSGGPLEFGILFLDPPWILPGSHPLPGSSLDPPWMVSFPWILPGSYLDAISFQEPSHELFLATYQKKCKQFCLQQTVKRPSCLPDLCP